MAALRLASAFSMALSVGAGARRWARGDLHILPLLRLLLSLGSDAIKLDQTLGSLQRSVRRYQSSLGRPADGYPTLELLQRLQ